VTEYPLDTNHISPLVTPGHPLRAKILQQIESGVMFAIALRYNLVLLTTDKDFHHIPTLHYENWR
jgi:predicted nuclease of predicted toxin-antitoxin system